MKAHVNINVDVEVLEHIRKSKQKNRFNFSHWVNQKYKEEFLEH